MNPTTQYRIRRSNGDIEDGWTVELRAFLGNLVASPFFVVGENVETMMVRGRYVKPVPLKDLKELNEGIYEAPTLVTKGVESEQLRRVIKGGLEHPVIKDALWDGLVKSETPL